MVVLVVWKGFVYIMHTDSELGITLYLSGYYRGLYPIATRRRAFIQCKSMYMIVPNDKRGVMTFANIDVCFS
jgi:hypothetical protein